MAYIQPNTRVLLLTGVPLDETYEHTLYFDNINAQISYFLGQKKYEFSPQTYQRKGIGYIKVNQRPELLYDCSYLMFQNTSYGNKWFYAFVLDVEYVNDATAIISYQIDWLQTWWFEITIHQCWIDREHIAVDAIGANLQEEGIELGELKTLETKNVYDDNLYVCLASTESGDLAYTYGNEFDHVIHPDNNYTECGLNACTIYCFGIKKKTNDNSKLVLDFILEYLENLDKLDSIVNCFVLPQLMVDTMVQGGRPRISAGFADTFQISAPVKNLKLLQYPYNVLEVTDNAGTSKVYRPELFSKTQVPQFDFGVGVSPVAEVYCLPKLYNGVEQGDIIGELDNGVIGSSLPQVPFSTDSYKVWIAQNSTWFGSHRIGGSDVLSPNVIQSLVGDLFKAGGSSALGKTVGVGAVAAGTAILAPEFATVGAAVAGGLALTHGITTIINSISRKSQAQLLPDKYNAGTGSTNIQLKNIGLSLIHKSINADYVQRIDSYFEMYGYKTNELKVPNTHSRPHWNYVKTSMANITGNIPSADLANIKSIFNNGITFWKHANEVGNYSLNNH